MKKYLWDLSQNTFGLFCCAAFLLLMMLPYRILWTEEARWAAIISEMLLRHDYFHPYVAGAPYYDKPLLSYWLSAGLAHLIGTFNEWALRLPSALSGLLIVYCTYRLGTIRFNKNTGLLAGWMLITTFFFIFWSRVAGADILNLAGIMLAVLWYFSHRDQTDFYSYFIFFLIAALTCLSKGLIGAAIIALVVLPDLIIDSWRKHLNLKFLLALILGLFIYILPFLGSQFLGHQNYHDNGLMKVYRENVLRFFHPFDHKDPIYTYFYYLPIYLLPWTIFFIPAIFNQIKYWRSTSLNEKWLSWVIILIFLVLTASGSRRSYYILPIVPFALLLTANWLNQVKWPALRLQITLWMISIALVGLSVWVVIVQPLSTLKNRGIWQFTNEIQSTAMAIAPWQKWQVIITPGNLKPLFYLKLRQPAQNGSPLQLLAADFKTQHPHTIFLTDPSNLLILQPVLHNYIVIFEPDHSTMALVSK